MILYKYIELSENEKTAICQKLNPYDKKDKLIFKYVEDNFKSEFGNIKGIEKIKCGLAPMLGPYNCLMVFIPKGGQRINIPKVYRGFPIEKIYESKIKSYKTLIGALSH